MAYEFYLGIDASGKNAPITLSLVEKAAAGQDGEPFYRVHRLEQHPDDDASAAQIAEHVQDLIADRPYTGRTIVVVNKTVGRGPEVVEAIAGRGLTPVGVALTGGDAAGQSGTGLPRGGGDDGGLTVSEHEVVDQIEELYRGGRLKLEDVQAEDGASLLAQGLESYHVNRHEAGVALNDITREPRRNAAHAGYVLSAGIACWLGEQHSFDPTDHLTGPLPLSGDAKREMRPDTTDHQSKVHEWAKNS